MLDSMRKAASGWVAKLLLGLLVVSFAIWGVSSSMLSGPVSNTVLKAGGASVSPVEFRLAYDRQLRAYSQQFGQRLTREQAVALGLDAQVLQQLSAGALLDNLAADMNLGISKDQIARLTAEDPSFFNASKQFDRQLFDRVLREVGMRPEDYLLNRAQVARRQQIVDSAGDGIAAPAAFLDALSIYQGETRDVSFVTLPQSLVEPVAAADDAKLKAWFETNKSEYAFPEFRGVRYLKLEPSDLASAVALTDDELKQDYDTNLARFTTPEQRTIQQLLFADRAAADAALASLATGKTFDDLMADQKKSAADATIGTFAKDAVTDAAVRDAAFAVAAAGGTSPVVDGTFGPVILRVTEIKPEETKAFDAVKEDIRKELALQRAAENVLDVHDAYEDARAGGASMKDAAASLNLKLVEIPAISRTGTLPDGSTAADLPAASDMLKAIFEAEIDAENPPLALGATGFLWAETTSIQPTREASFDEVKTRVAADWLEEETARLLDEKAEALTAEIKAGKSLAEIATALALTVETATGLSRGAEAIGLGAAGVDAAFATEEKQAAVVASANGDARVLLVVDKAGRPTADAGRVEGEKARVAQSVSDDLLEQLVGRLRTETPVTVDQAAIDRALNF